MSHGDTPAFARVTELLLGWRLLQVDCCAVLAAFRGDGLHRGSQCRIRRPSSNLDSNDPPPPRGLAGACQTEGEESDHRCCGGLPLRRLRRHLPLAGEDRELSARSSDRDPASAANPRISPAAYTQPRRIQVELPRNPPEPAFETRRKSRQSPKIPLRPRSTVIDVDHYRGTFTVSFEARPGRDDGRFPGW